jgi:hypothetical protein
MHNHDERVALDEPVSLALEATHELAWFPRDQRPGGANAPAADPDAAGREAEGEGESETETDADARPHEHEHEHEHGHQHE